MSTQKARKTLTRVYFHQPVRILQKDGRHYFVFLDICRILGIASSKCNEMFYDVTGRQCEYEQIRTNSGRQFARIVSTEDLLLFLKEHKSATASRLSTWIGNEYGNADAKCKCDCQCGCQDEFEDDDTSGKQEDVPDDEVPAENTAAEPVNVKHRRNEVPQADSSKSRVFPLLFLISDDIFAPLLLSALPVQRRNEKAAFNDKR